MRPHVLRKIALAVGAIPVTAAAVTAAAVTAAAVTAVSAVAAIVFPIPVAFAGVALTRAYSQVPGAVHAISAVVGTRTQPAVEDCGFKPEERRPKSLTLSCADAGSIGEDLVWHSWGAAQAYATGTYTWHICTPYCAASNKWGKTTATFTLEQPVHTNVGWLFEKLVVHLKGKAGGTPPVIVYIWKPIAAAH